MSKWSIRIPLLLLIFTITATIAALPQDNRLFAKNESRTPATLNVTTPDGTIVAKTSENTLIQALDEARIPLGEGDMLSHPDDMILESGQEYEVTLVRRNNVKLNWSGYEIDTSSEFMSMGDLVSRAGYEGLDLVGGRIEQSEVDEAQTNGGIIAYVDIEKKEIRNKEIIPFATETIEDDSLYIGKTKVKTEGVNGEQELVYEETYENGVLISTVLVETIVLSEPVTEVIRKGTNVLKSVYPRTQASKVRAAFERIKPLLNENGNSNYYKFSDNDDGTITVDGKTFSYIDVEKRTITMYDGLEVCLQTGCHSPAINHSTASGIKAQRGIVATYRFRVDGKFAGTVLPLGTTLFIEGYGLAVVADMHGAYWNKQLLDACYDGGEIRRGEVTWGKRTKRVYIISLP